MTFIVATNVVASRPPERRRTGTPHAHAKIMAFLVATTSLPAVYRPNDDARTTTAGTPHACAKILGNVFEAPMGAVFLDSLDRTLEKVWEIIVAEICV